MFDTNIRNFIKKKFGDPAQSEKNQFFVEFQLMFLMQHIINLNFLIVLFNFKIFNFYLINKEFRLPLNPSNIWLHNVSFGIVNTYVFGQKNYLNNKFKTSLHKKKYCTRFFSKIRNTTFFQKIVQFSIKSMQYCSSKSITSMVTFFDSSKSALATQNSPFCVLQNSI